MNHYTAGFHMPATGEYHMLALKITDVKDFTNKLFIGEVFDRFWLNEASITTFSTFSIDGKLQPDFFDSDEKEILASGKRTYALWKELKPYCFSIIRGKKTPLFFKLVFQFPPERIFTPQNDGTGIYPDINGLFLNIQFKNNLLMCTTGVSLKTFIPGVKPDALWDSKILEFFRKNQIVFEEV